MSIDKYLSNSPAPGIWEMNSSTLISGEKTEIEIRYTHGEMDFPPGSYHRILYEPLSVKRLFLCLPSDGIKVVPYKGKLPEVVLEPKVTDGVGFRDVKIVFPKGLTKGQSFAIAIGNDTGSGNLKAIVNPVPVKGLTWETYSKRPDDEEELNWLRMGWADSLPKVDVLAAPASALRIFGPTLIETSKKFNLRIAVTDDFDSRAEPAYEGEIKLELSDRIDGLPQRITFSKSDNCTKLLKGLSISTPGVYRIRATLVSVNKSFETNPIVVRKKVATPIYWGSLHNHTCYSECWCDSLDNTYRFAREISGFDFVSTADHKGMLPRRGSNASRILSWRLGKRIDGFDAWKDNIDKANEYNRPGEFVTLFGYEWSATDAGHHNIYNEDASVEGMKKIFLKKYTDYAFTMREHLKKSENLFIPHTHAEVFPYATLKEVNNSEGKPLSPVMEVYSDWGCSFYPQGKFPIRSRFGGEKHPLGHSYLWALEKGYKLGAIGDSDTHTGLPGRRNPGGISPEHCHPQGITALATNKFDRRGIMNAYHERRTYATTGERIFLEVLAEGTKMGETLRIDRPFSIKICVAGTDVIESISLYNGLSLVEEKRINGACEGEVVFNLPAPPERETAYVVAVIQKDENRAYSTPIWVQKASIPELGWESDDEDRGYLINNGKAEAKDIEIMYSKDEHPFVLEEMPLRECSHDESAGMIWTTRRDNHRTTLHYRWHDNSMIKGKAVLKGVKKYELDYNRHFIWFGGKIEERKDSQLEFFISEEHFIKGCSKGFDIIITPDPENICEALFEFKRNVKTIIGEKEENGKTARVRVNGRTSSGSLTLIKIPSLKPGERWKIPNKRGYWSLDPYNRFVIFNEENNPYYIK